MADDTVHAVSPPNLETIEIDERYRILRKLGQGGAGTVYEAEQLDMQRSVALKVVSTLRDTTSVQRFQRECQALSRLQHPNIVHVFAWGVSKDGRPYFAMEFVNGASLADVIRDEGALSVERVIAIASQVCDALTYAHELGIVHRDIKPANIMLCKDASGAEIVKILDFGIAAFADAEVRLTKTDVVVGTPAYMAPEQFMAHSEIDGRADVYSLACTLYEALCAKRAIAGESSFEVFNAHMAHASDPMPPSIPVHVREAIRAAMIPILDKRIASAEKFKRCLLGLDTAIGITQPMDGAQVAKAQSRSKALILPLVAGICVIAACTFGLMFNLKEFGMNNGYSCRVAAINAFNRGDINDAQSQYDLHVKSTQAEMHQALKQRFMDEGARQYLVQKLKENLEASDLIFGKLSIQSTQWRNTLGSIYTLMGLYPLAEKELVIAKKGCDALGKEGASTVYDNYKALMKLAEAKGHYKDAVKHAQEGYRAAKVAYKNAETAMIRSWDPDREIPSDRLWLAYFELGRAQWLAREYQEAHDVLSNAMQQASAARRTSQESLCAAMDADCLVALGRLSEAKLLLSADFSTAPSTARHIVQAAREKLKLARANGVGANVKGAEGAKH